MNQFIKKLGFACLLSFLLLGLLACSAQENPYQDNDNAGYNVSVRFDANGGSFTTNTYIITDSFSLSGLKTNSSGMVELPLLSPDDARRGSDAFSPVRTGYFLAGWYAEKTDTLDQNGASVTVYNKKWNFETDVLTVDPTGTYSAAQPQLTLYAAWVPLFSIEFYDLQTGSLLDTYEFDPGTGTQFPLPAWDEASGALTMHRFPKKDGFTFSGAYLDAAGKQPVSGSSLAHPGQLDETNGTGKNTVMQVYVDYTEGNWFKISSAEQFIANALPDGCYELQADLDFTDKIWPTALMYGNFSGKILGNGHSIRNVAITQTNNSKVNAGLFGQLTEQAQLQDVTFENITFTIKAGAMKAGTNFGLLAGTLSSGAQLKNVAVRSSALLIDSGCYFGSDDYAIGLICGMGDPQALTVAEVTCTATGAEPSKIQITVSDQQVSLVFAS